MPTSVQAWLLGDDTGISSKAIVAHMTGMNTRDYWSDHPRDPSDFGRCHRLLLLAPAWQICIGKMASRSLEWAALVDAWDELTEMYQRVEPRRGEWVTSESRKMYDRMRALLEPAEKEHSRQAKAARLTAP